MAKVAPINMRTTAEQFDLLTKAANALNTDRTSFILNIACREAENVLLDRRLFQLTDEGFDAFEVALDEPLTQSEKLKRLLIEPAPWEK
ncbi:DUF1778 domain-containing protein [Piscirickettsia salmonis]|uniref:type II toxin-antitoxin system TacA family antitoxin n=1 Tax=Piscirickettsia salmonis TaxID=1238 RepID=UPI003EBFD7DA